MRIMNYCSLLRLVFAASVMCILEQEPSFSHDLKTKIERKIVGSTVRIFSPSSSVGSGILVHKENNTYYVLTAAHVLGRQVCLNKQLIDTGDIEVMTHDNSYHQVLAEKIICPHIPYSKSLNKLCINKNYSSMPWSLDMALIAFKSRIDYEVVSKYASIKRNGFHVYVSGYPDISEDEVKIFKSNGPANLPPKYSSSTCKGYGLRYIVPPRVGMSGGGVWSHKGHLIGIHGQQEQSRDKLLAFSEGAISVGIPIDYWKEKNNFSAITAIQPSAKDTNTKQQVANLLSRARAFINLSRVNDREKFIGESTFILDELLKAESYDLQQPIIPAMIAQVYLRRYQDAETPSYEDLILARDKINKAIRLSEHWGGSYKGNLEPIRARIHSLRGDYFISRNRFGLGKDFYIKALNDINTRLSLVSHDVSSLKDKALYLHKLGDNRSAINQLRIALTHSPNDPYIFHNQAIYYGHLGDFREACIAISDAQHIIRRLKKNAGGVLELDIQWLNGQMIEYSKSLRCS